VSFLLCIVNTHLKPLDQQTERTSAIIEVITLAEGQRHLISSAKTATNHLHSYVNCKDILEFFTHGFSILFKRFCVPICKTMEFNEGLIFFFFSHDLISNYYIRFTHINGCLCLSVPGSVLIKVPVMCAVAVLIPVIAGVIYCRHMRSIKDKYHLQTL